MCRFDNENYESVFEAANKGNADAQYELALMYYHGDFDADGVATHYHDIQAFEWCGKAADQGHADAQFILGIMHFRAGGQKNEAIAIDFYNKAADQGHANAQHIIAQRFYEGRFMEQSYTKALEYYKKAALQNIVEAQITL